MSEQWKPGHFLQFFKRNEARLIHWWWTHSHCSSTDRGGWMQFLDTSLCTGSVWEIFSLRAIFLRGTFYIWVVASFEMLQVGWLPFEIWGMLGSSFSVILYQVQAALHSKLPGSWWDGMEFNALVSTTKEILSVFHYKNLLSKCASLCLSHNHAQAC